MGDFERGARVRLTDAKDRAGTVVSYTEETIGQECNRFLLVRWDGSDATIEPIHQSRFEPAG